MALSVLGEGGLEFSASIDLTSFEASMEQMKKRFQEIALSAEQANKKQLDDLRRSLGLSTKEIQQQAAEVESFTKKASIAAASYFSLQAADSFIRKMVDVRSEFQKLQAVLTNSLGSSSDAQQAFAMITDYASKTPFQVREVTESYVKLINQGLKPTREQLESLGDLAASTGKSFDQITEAILDAQTGEFERLKEFGIKASQSGDQVAFTFKGVTTTVAKTSEAIDNYIIGLGKLQGISGATAAISATLGGQISNLEDSFDRMFNEIGQNSEGIISETISGVAFLVDNYQQIINIIEVLIATYGSYKAALLVTTAYEKAAALATRAQTLAHKELNAVQIIGVGLMKNLQAAYKAMSAALASNPVGIAVAGITALASTLYLLRNKIVEVKSATELLEDAAKDANSTFGQQEAVIKTYVGQLQNQNLAEKTRLEAYTKLQELAPEIIKNLSFQEAKTSDLTDATNAYISSLRQRITLESRQTAYANALKQRDEAFAAAEKAAAARGNREKSFVESSGNVVLNEYGQAAAAFEKADEVVANIERSLSNTIGNTSEALKARIEDLRKEQSLLTEGSARYKDYQKQIDSLTISYNNALRAEKGLAQNQPVVKNQAWYDAEIKRLKALQAPLAITSKGYKDLQVQIDKLERERNPQKTAKETLAAENRAQKELNDLLEQRKSLMDEIAATQKESADSSLPKEASEVEKIHNKYVALYKKIQDFNSTAPASQKIGMNELISLQYAEFWEKLSKQYEQDAQRYIDNLAVKKQAFDAYQKAVIELGADAANKIYGSDLHNFDKYIAYLNAELAKVEGKTDKASVIKKEALGKEITTAKNNKRSEETQDLIDATKATQTYNVQRKKIDEDYYRQKVVLEKQYNGNELAERLKILDEIRGKSIDAAKNEIFQKSELYQQLNQDIIELSRRQIKSEIEAIQTVLSKGVDIPPALQKQMQDRLADLQIRVNFSSRTNYLKDLEQQKKNIEAALASGKLSTEEYIKQEQHLREINNQLEHAKKTNDELAKTLQDASDSLNEISGAFSNLASSIAPFNEGLADTLQTVSDIGNVLGNAAGAAASFASGDIVGGITKTINAIAGIFSIGAKARESERKAQAELKAYQDSIIKGEISYNELLRERQRTIKNINELTTEQLQQQLKLMDAQKQAASLDEQRLLNLIRLNGQQVTGEHTEKYGGFLGIGRKTKVVQDLAGLSDTDYNELEQLYTEGKLTDSTKEWFEQLKAVHDEINGIADDSEAVKDRLNEVLTGTTADAITDTIERGFENGYSAVADFGDDIKSIITKALFSSFEANIIKPAIQPLYDEIAKLATDGLDSFDISKIVADFNSVLVPLTEQANELQNALSSVNISGAQASQNSLVGASQRATEQTMELLAGQFGALRLTSAEQLSIATQHLNQLILIENHTSNLPMMKDLLSQMNNLWKQINNNGIKIRS